MPVPLSPRVRPPPKRLLKRASSLVGQDEAPPNAKPIRLVGTDDKRLWFDSSERERIVGKLYPLYREPGRHVIGFLEEQN